MLAEFSFYFVMLKFSFFSGLLLLSSLIGWGQPTRPFLKISHLGTASRPIIDLYLTAETPELNAAQGLDGRYRFESVCLLPEAELTPLLRYAEDYLTKTRSDGKNTKYGTFELTLGSAAEAQKGIYARSKALTFLNGAVHLLEKQAADADTNEALHRLRVTIRRLSAGNP